MPRRLLYLLLFLALPGIATAQSVADANPSGRVENAVENAGNFVPRPDPGLFELPPVDLFQARLDDEERVIGGNVAQYAVALPVDVTPWTHGVWELTNRGEARWRLRISSPGALSLNLAFALYRMPEGGRLLVRSDGRRFAGGEESTLFTAHHNETHRQLWTPPFSTDSLTLELTLPIERLVDLELRLFRVHHGYAGFGEPAPLSGGCERDVACIDSPSWQTAARAVGLVSVEGVRFCTGFLVNNTAMDGRPFFITAEHCGVTPENAASVVVMWNYASADCRDDDEAAIDPPSSARRAQSGAVWRATHTPSDAVLLELDDPPDPEWNLFYAGWDRSPTEPLGSAVIHHPNTDMKRISFDHDRARATLHLGQKRRADGDHLRVGGWEYGTTEGGSSGAPLFNQDQRVVGQLHGGYAACGNRDADWFGRFSAAWAGDGQPGGRFSDWLDPLKSEAVVLDGLESAALADVFE